VAKLQKSETNDNYWLIIPKSASSKTQLVREPEYDDWNPPSPAIIYCKIRNIPYDQLSAVFFVYSLFFLLSIFF